MQRVRALLAVVLVASLALVPVGEAEALAPFPTHDDEVRLFVELNGPACGAGIQDPGTIVDHFEGIPASGATYQYWFFYDGRLVRETAVSPLEVTGTGSRPNPLTFYWNAPSYPVHLSLQARVFVDGRATYRGGHVLTCWSIGGAPVLAEAEHFSEPCGVGDIAVLPDVPASNPFCDDVHWALQRQITTGYPDGGYHPAAPVTRQAMAAFLQRSSNHPTPPACVGWPFLDVPPAHPFCAEILWLSGQGITAGYGDGTFRPGAAVTRQAMAAFLYRVAGEPRGADPACTGPAFPDVPSAHPFCGEIDWLADVGITEGYADGGYHPADAVSRQAMAAFLRRLELLT